MAKRKSKHKSSQIARGSQYTATLREENTGKLSKGNACNNKSLLKLEHLQNLAVWANSEALVPSLGAVYGRHLAEYREAIGAPPDPSLFHCERCESILQPGFNCTIRIEKNRAKVRRRRRSRSKPTQNNVVYTCHFCSHRNLMRGTPKGRMKEIRPPKPKRAQQKPVQRVAQKGSDLERETESNVKSTADQMVSPPLATEKDAAGSPVTPLKGRCSLLLEGKRRKRRKSGSKKPTESEKSNAEDAEKVASASSKRRRRSWTSLKEIAESGGRDGSSGINNLAIPFFI